MDILIPRRYNHISIFVYNDRIKMNASISVLVASLTTREASIDPGLGFPGLVVNEATVTSILESIPVTKASPMQCAGTALCTAWHMIARSTYTHTHLYIYIYNFDLYGPINSPTNFDASSSNARLTIILYIITHVHCEIVFRSILYKYILNKLVLKFDRNRIAFFCCVNIYW